MKKFDFSKFHNPCNPLIQENYNCSSFALGSLLGLINHSVVNFNQIVEFQARSNFHITSSRIQLLYFRSRNHQSTCTNNNYKV